MTNKEKVLNRERERGRLAALEVQEKSSEMTGTELNSVSDNIPMFSEAVKVMNMLNRKAGQADGFVCKSSAGRVVRLIQNYDSDIYTQEPEELSAQWRFVWSTDPSKALPFISISTSPYDEGEYCLNNAGIPCKSLNDTNVWSPDEAPSFWQVYEDGEN